MTPHEVTIHDRSDQVHNEYLVRCNCGFFEITYKLRRTRVIRDEHLGVHTGHSF